MRVRQWCLHATAITWWQIKMNTPEFRWNCHNNWLWTHLQWDKTHIYRDTKITKYLQKWKVFSLSVSTNYLIIFCLNNNIYLLLCGSLLFKVHVPNYFSELNHNLLFNLTQNHQAIFFFRLVKLILWIIMWLENLIAITNL